MWQYDADIYLRGEAYFAITPSAVMGGGRLDIVVNKSILGGTLSVRVLFSAYADFLMHLHPFSFEASVGISLYASAELYLLLFTLYFGPLEFSADLWLHGPPLGGEVKVHLWRWDIQVVFGPPPARPKPLTLPQFIRMVKNLPLEASAEKPDESVPGHLVSITGGRVPTDGTEGAMGPIEVFAANVRIEIHARVPVLMARISGYSEPLASTVTDTNGRSSTPELFARPMQLTEKFGASELAITLKGPDADEIALEAQPVVKEMPPAIWGKGELVEHSIHLCKLTVMPSDVAKPDLTAPMISHVAGYTLTVRQNKPSLENIPAINMREFNTVDVGQNPEHGIPPILPVEDLDDDDRFQLKSERGVKVRAKSSSDGQAKQRRRKKDAVAAWDLFKRVCSGGGMGKEAKRPMLFKVASESTSRS